MSRMCIDSGAGTKEIPPRGRKQDSADPCRTPDPFRCRREGSFKSENNPLAKSAALPRGALIMRYRVIALLSAVLSALTVLCIAAKAEEAKNDVKGLFLLTDYPAVTLRPGTTSAISLILQNYGVPTKRLTLSVNGDTT